MAQNLTSSRSSVTEEMIREWFQKVHEYFVDKEITVVLEDPSRVYNCDETAFFAPARKASLSEKRIKDGFQSNSQ